MTLKFRQVALWLMLVIGLCYAGSMTGGFHFDDTHSVESNLAVRSVANIPQFWTDARTSSFIPENRVYRPLVYTFYSFCWWVGGGKTWAFHLMKMAMHLLVCLAIFRIWSRLWREPGWFPVEKLKIQFPFLSHVFNISPDWAAFFLSLTFAVHPAASECVDYISATTSLQCALFYLWAYLSYLDWRDSGARKALGLSLFLFFLSVASKEEGITLPAMVFVTELFLFKASKERFAQVLGAARRTIPFAALAMVLAGWIYVMHPESGNESRGWVTPFQYFLTQWRAYLWYMRLWFWPWDLNADNASIEFSKSLLDPLVIRAAIGNLLVLAFSWFNRKRFPAMLFGILWFYITISPASSVVVLAEAINEHRMYLAYVGFIGGTMAVLLFCAERFFASETRAKRLGWIYSAVLLGLVIGTQERNRVWQTDENLWADTVEKNPTSGRALNNLGLVYLGRGQYDKATDLLNRCEVHWPTYMYCSLNKGIAYFGLASNEVAAGKREEAEKHFVEAEKSLLRAYQFNPRSVHVNFHLARYYDEVQRNCLKASDLYKTSVELTGGRYPAADLRLAGCYTQMKRFDEARVALQRATDIDPGNESIQFEKARLEFESGNAGVSLVDYGRLLERNPKHLKAWYNYGVVLLSKNDFSGARNAFAKVISLDPRSEQAWLNLAFAAERVGDGKSALEAARNLVGINPSKPEYQERLKELQKRFGNS